MEPTLTQNCVLYYAQHKASKRRATLFKKFRAALDVTVERNAFGRQLDSFETDLAVPLLGDQPVHGVFIRAPVIERVGPEVDVMATLDDGRIVAVRQRNVIATAFHPELAGETRFHRLVATMAAEHADPGEGVGRRPYPTRRSRQAG